MADTGALLTFAALSFALIVVPGPSVMFVIGRAVALGRRAALLTVVGNAAGVYVQVLLVAAGLGAIVEQSVLAYNVVKYVGAAYLVLLGVRALRSPRTPAVEEEVDATAVPPTMRPVAVLREGFVVGIANPKAMVFFAAFLPQFTTPDGMAVPLQMAVLGVVFVAIALVSDGAWGLAAGTARDWFARSPDRLATLRRAGGLVMVGIGVQVALTGRPD